ncbi:hypothetical protein PSTG_02389 [Puccinia striiformis f. sp. tritici PST-78]|uniref:Reverse transcriptase domain-containing protein n=1 Tax=Puccinia striiformis f. sp. tritici PST-78 TaxID=1165861 RepID=A0A0L0VYY4_9BASI|nr:hypothetical protein PSTG_02389 [Puccinia striiformis f. sp. tritici PST-78]
MKISSCDEGRTTQKQKIHSQSKPLLKPPTLVNRSTLADAVLLTEPIKGGTILFINGTVPSHNETGFTPYFNKAIRTLCGIIPLTIFDKEWQAEAIGAHIKKQSKTDEKNGEYTGFSYPNEWSQSFAKWTSNYCNFLVTIRDVYDHKDFAVWIVKHKENVDNIIAVDGFLTGFRYDIQVRQNAFAFRKKRDGVELMTDISVLRTTIRDEAWSLTRKLDELDYTDNPYVRGGSKPEWDPRTGKPKIPKNPRWNSDGIFDREGQKGGRFRNQEGGQGGSDYGGWSGSQKRKGNWGGSNSNDNRGNGYENRQSGSGGNNQYRNEQNRGKGGGNANSNKRDGRNDQTGSMPLTTSCLQFGNNIEDDKTWPLTISCKMNVPAWCKALEINNLLPRFQDVLDGMRFFTPENHRSSALARDKIEESIKKELAAGRMFGPFTHDYVERKFEFFRSNPLGAVVNGDGSVRPINDLSYPRNDSAIRSVNSFVRSDDFETTWDDFQTVSRFFAGEDRPLELALFDWEKAYRQIPTRKDQWRYLLVQDFDGNLLLDTRITFGGVAGCGSFGQPADAWKLIMRNHFRLVNIFRWVDDNLFVRFQGDDVSMEEVVIKSQELGVMTNRSKYSPFGNEQKFIGFIWNGVLKTVRLPEEKIAQRIAQIEVFLDVQQKFSYEQVKVLAGRLNHVSYLLPHLKCHLNSLYRWLKSWIYRKAKQFTPMDVVLDLRKWVDTLENFEPTRIINWGPPIDVGWVGDASTSFGVGILVGKKWAQFRLFEPGNTPGRIALLETIAVRLGLLMLLKLRDQRNKSLVVWTDNTTTENSINNLRSRDVKTNQEWMKIQDILIANRVHLVARRVVSKDNKADTLSRGVRSGQVVRDQVVVALPVDLTPVLEQVVFLV